MKFTAAFISAVMSGLVVLAVWDKPRQFAQPLLLLLIMKDWYILVQIKPAVNRASRRLSRCQWFTILTQQIITKPSHRPWIQLLLRQVKCARSRKALWLYVRKSDYQDRHLWYVMSCILRGLTRTAELITLPISIHGIGHKRGGS